MSSYLSLLLIIFLPSLLLFLHPQTSYAQTKKQSPGIWQLITLKKLLIAQQVSLIKPKQVMPTIIAPQEVLSTNAIAQEGTDDIQTFLMQEINTYRANYGLGKVSTSEQTCNFARIRAEEITHRFNHDGFYNRSANNTLPYASGKKAVENLAMAPNYKDVVKLWADSPTHAANMRSDSVYVCVVKNGDYYAYEGMTP